MYECEMATATVRTYLCSSPSSTAVPAGVWTHAGNTTWNVRPELWPFICAFVIRRPYKPASLLTVLAEVALLMEHTNWRPGADLSWSAAAMSCPSHMSRFLTESLGLCIAVESASAYGWTPLLALLDADRLDKSSPLYVGTGSRPDFIAQSQAGWHGIEARGRGATGPVKPARPVASQTKKLEGMHQWSGNVATNTQATVGPSWSMSWAWISDSRTAVDHFDPGEPVELAAEDEQVVWARMESIAKALAVSDDSRVEIVNALGREMSVASRPILDNPDSGARSWLTVASWTTRLAVSDLPEVPALQIPAAGQDLSESLGGLDRSVLGAFMATAITNRQPETGELALLFEALAADTAVSFETDQGNAER